MAFNDLFIDFTLASILILVGQYLRAKMSIFQKFFMPASMIAGFLGLILGPPLLNILPFSGSAESYAATLIIFIFTILGLNGFEFNKDSGKEEAKRIIGFQLFRIVALFFQFLIPILLTAFVFQKIWPDLNTGFGMLLVSGFYGGHGTAAAVGETFVQLGWADAPDLAITFATIGILTGVFVGLALIKNATKKGETAYVKDFEFVDEDLKTGLVRQENRKSLGQETISPVSLETLTFHLSLIIGVAGASFMLNNYIGENVISGIPTFTLAYIVALIFFLFLRNTNLYHYIDTDINDKIAGTFTDYLVFFGIASIKLGVVAKYAGPLLLMTMVGIGLVVMIVKLLGRGYNKDSWFERSIFVFGYSTGVFAIGFVLLRIVDPEGYSKTLEDTAITPLTNFIEIILWTTYPALLYNGNWLVAAGLMLAGIILCGVVTLLTGSWVYDLPKHERKALGLEEA